MQKSVDAIAHDTSEFGSYKAGYLTPKFTCKGSWYSSKTVSEKSGVAHAVISGIGWPRPSGHPAR